MIKFSPLPAYVAHVLEKPFNNLLPAFSGVYTYGKTLGIVIDRNDCFQTELFIVPNSVELIEYHNHPNVDSFEMHISGDFVFEINGVKYPSSPEVVHLNQKTLAYVAAEDIHGAIWNSSGAFLSFQYWKNGVKPTSVIEDFKLDENNENHKKGLKGKNEIN